MDSEDEHMQGDIEDVWNTSSSSAEEWDDEEANNAFRMSIVGEEIRNGQLRFCLQPKPFRHEVLWEDWKRRNGTSNTWRPNEEGVDEETLEAWNDMVAANREKLAEGSLDIEIWSDLNNVNTDTRLRGQAYDEKRQKRYGEPVSLVERMRANLVKHGHATPANAPRRTNVASRRNRNIVESGQSRSSTASTGRSRDSPEAGPSTSRAKPRNSRPSRVLTPSVVSESEDEDIRMASPSPSPSPPPSYKGKGKERAHISPVIRTPEPSSKGKGKEKCLPSQGDRVRSAGEHQTQKSTRVIARLPRRAGSSSSASLSRSTTLKSGRDALAAEWTAKAESVGAKPIAFVNEVDSEEIPALVPDFVYLEAELD
ncbi:hypothetical protein PQX77_009818 [Marasmius sp. AFHP31]|nr:hypothetical protein PQX77_009818 [Marasmius sp. AFHP31]